MKTVIKIKKIFFNTFRVYDMQMISNHYFPVVLHSHVDF